MDVKALYTNIPNKEGLQALKGAFDKKQHKSIATTVIVTLMTLILTLNNFVFNEKKLPSNQRMCYGDDMCTPICEYFHGQV